MATGNNNTEGREMNETIHLQGIGRAKAKRLDTFKPGEFIMWNYGYVAEIVEMVPSASGKTFKVTLIEDGKTYVRKMAASRLAAIGTAPAAPEGADPEAIPGNACGYGREEEIEDESDEGLFLVTEKIDLGWKIVESFKTWARAIDSIGGTLVEHVNDNASEYVRDGRTYRVITL
jgi:hypothetical protein